MKYLEDIFITAVAIMTLILGTVVIVKVLSGDICRAQGYNSNNDQIYVTDDPVSTPEFPQKSMTIIHQRDLLQ